MHIAMEYIEYGDLSQYISQHAEEAKMGARAIITQILEGLVVLHEREICHRDLKPQVCSALHRILLMSCANESVEHPHRVTLPDMGQDHRFRNLEELWRLGLANPLRNGSISGP